MRRHSSNDLSRQVRIGRNNEWPKAKRVEVADGAGTTDRTGNGR